MKKEDIEKLIIEAILDGKDTISIITTREVSFKEALESCEDDDKPIKKYEFTGETLNHYGRTLHRIKRIEDGLVGGFIEKEDNLSHEGACFVYDNAKIFGNAKVCGNAEVFGKARVSGKAKVSGNAKISGDARVFGDAQVYWNAWVCGDAKVCGKAEVCGDTEIYGIAKVCGNKNISKSKISSGIHK